jgi:hypothetical protein
VQYLLFLLVQYGGGAGIKLCSQFGASSLLLYLTALLFATILITNSRGEIRFVSLFFYPYSELLQLQFAAFDKRFLHLHYLS